MLYAIDMQISIRIETDCLDLVIMNINSVEWPFA